MGALAGIIHYRGRGPAGSVLERVSERLRHRGPDGEGFFYEGPAGLVQRRRGLINPDRTAPQTDDDFVVLMDGRLYDQKLLARSAGVPEDTADVALVAAAWRRWGVDAATRLHGAYAIAVWDRKNSVLHLLRDRMGIRPLFWARSGPRFAFASELPALLEVPWVSRELAREHLAEYLSFRVVHAPRTLLEDVHQLEPAHRLRVNPDGVESRRYWAPLYAPPGTPVPRSSDVVPALQEMVQSAVERRLTSGADVGLYLSGGLGSTAIAASAKRLGHKLPTFTISFADDLHPESPFAGRVASLLGLEHHEFLVGTKELADSFDAGMDALGHPIGNPAAFLQMELARRTREFVPVVLSGDGGDELFGGRMLDDPARWLHRAERFQAAVGPLRHLLAPALSKSRRGRRLLTDPHDFGPSLGIGGSNLFDLPARQRLFADPALVRPTVRQDVLRPFYSGLDTDPLNAILHAYSRSWLGEESLARADRTAAANGMSIYFPLLDREVLSMACALPGDFKVRRSASGLHTRWPLQEMLSGILPPVLVNRPKRGLPTPLDHWLAGPGRLFLEDRFSRLQRDPEGLYQQDELQQLRRNILKRKGSGLKLWALFQLDAWLEHLR